MQGGAGEDSERFDAVTLAFHWLTVALVAGQFASAWTHDLAADGHQAASLLAIHRSTGVVLWTLTLARLVWRAGWGRRRPLPTTVPPLQRGLARANAWTLVTLLVVQPLTGLAQELMRGKPFALLIGHVPAIVARHRELVRAFHQIHEIGAWLLLALILAHALAALGHHFILRDGVLIGMLPKFPGAGGNKPPPAIVSTDNNPSMRTQDDA